MDMYCPKCGNVAVQRRILDCPMDGPYLKCSECGKDYILADMMKAYVRE